MTDLDPEMIEKVAIATYDAMQHPNWRAPLWGEIDELGRERFLNVARAALEAVADDLRAEGAVKALREAAGYGTLHFAVTHRDQWSRGRLLVTQAWLRDRADQIEKGGQP